MGRQQIVKKVKRITALLLTAAFLISVIMPVYADELEESRAKLQDVSRQIQQQKNNISNVKKQEKSILDQLNDVETNIATTQQEIDALDDKISYLEKDIDKTEQEIKEREEKLQEQIDYLSERLVYMYEDGMEVSYMEVLFSATDIKDFLTRYDLLQFIVENDMELIETINKEKRALDVKKADLEIQKRELVDLKASQEAKKAQLSEQREEKQVLLGNVRQEKSSYEKALKELEQASRELEAIIRKAQTGEQLGTGVYTWPAPGYSSITSPYGWRYHPILKVNKLHTGVDIGAPMGANIVAADAGKVIYAGWQNGYGQTVIIDHGAGKSTLYGHQSKIMVSYGQSVDKGQIIGKVGSTGWSTGPHLHFEVRINGSPTNPMSYL
jgi:murein DD-endopeptidase MepM/ murein hydrolase activator NlpD